MIVFISLIFGCSNTTNNKQNQTDTIDSRVSISSAETIQINELPVIGDLINDSIIMKCKNKSLLINSSDVSPFATVIYKGLVFDVAWSGDKRVKYLSTSDSHFVTDENVKVNMTLKDIKDILRVEIVKTPGWAYSIKLKSGWNAAFCVDSICTGRAIIDNDKVKWIYKN